jgi:hypothetical protein
VDVDPTVTSARAVVGKDLLALGLLAGAGWDRYQGSGRLQMRPDLGGCCGADAEDFQADRLLFFGGASLNFLVIQLAAEAGWARGFDDVAGRAAGGRYDPAAGSLFGNVALRLTL